MSVRSVSMALLTAATLTATPGVASADWLITPFVGANFGGDASFGDFDNFDDEFERRVDFGGSLGWMGSGIVGFEVDFGFSPNFFQDTSGEGDFEFGDSNVTTAMGNLLIGIPVGGQTGGGVRPYATAGLGLIRSSIDGGTLFNDLESNDFGFNLGAGVHAFFNDNVGIRGDVRYFRTFGDDEPGSGVDLALRDFDFWRATAGVTFRFTAP